MARASIPTLLPLNTFAALMGLDLFEFNQVETPYTADKACRDVFYQYSYQVPNYITREEIAQAIASAERLLAGVLGFWVAPQYITNEQRALEARRAGRYGVNYGYNYAYNTSGYRVNSYVQTRYQQVITGGALARTLVGAMAVTRVDLDGDGILEAFTVTIATTLTDVNEIGVYFNSADRTTAPLSEAWRLQPVTVTIAAGVATITGHASLLVKPSLQVSYGAQALDVADANTYVTSVDVYRVYTDTAEQGTATWQPYTYGCPDLPCEAEITDICLAPINPAMGQMGVTLLDTQCCIGWRDPNFVTLNYLAGAALDNGQMRTEYADWVAKLAAGLLPNLSCGCERADAILQYWRQDMTETYLTAAGAQNPVMLTVRDTQSPLGFSRGALYVWKRIPYNEQIAGFSL